MKFLLTGIALLPLIALAKGDGTTLNAQVLQQAGDAGDDAGGGVASVHFHATVLHLLGIYRTKLTFRHNGRDFRLTDAAERAMRQHIQAVPKRLKI